VAVKETGSPSGGLQLRDGLWVWLSDRLSRPWWLGLGVVLATLMALLIYFLGSGGSLSYANNGSCVAQGNGNTVTCRGPSAGTGR
jgi:hypothetical protein